MFFKGEWYCRYKRPVEEGYNSCYFGPQDLAILAFLDLGFKFRTCISTWPKIQCC